MRGMHVSYFETGTLARQSTRSECRDTPLMGETRKRVGLVHELGELAGAEELLDGCYDRPNVDERLRRDLVHVLCRHAFTHHALHPREPDAELVLDQLADAADASIAEMVDVVHLVAIDPIPQLHQILHAGEDILGRECRLRIRQSEAELLIHLVAPTFARSYRCSLKNKPSNSERALSTVGGSPGRSRL